MKNQQNKQTVDEMEAAMLAASEKMKTRQQERWNQRELKRWSESLSLSLSLNGIINFMLYFFFFVGSRSFSLQDEHILELQEEHQRELDSSSSITINII